MDISLDLIVNPPKKCPLDRGPVIGVGSLIDLPIHPPEHPTPCQFPIRQFIRKTVSFTIWQIVRRELMDFLFLCLFDCLFI